MCLRAQGFCHVRTHKDYASYILVWSLCVQCSRACECYPMRSSIRIFPSSQEMSDKCLRLEVWVPLLQRHGKDSDPADSARVEQRFRAFVPPCLDSNTQGHVLLLRLSQRRVQLHAHHDESWCLGSYRICSFSRAMRNKAFVSRGPVPPLPQHSFSPRGHRFDLQDPHTHSK